MTGESLAVRRNNILSIAVGIVVLVFLITILITGTSMGTFIALVVIGGVT